MNSPTIVRVEDVSKKFCRELKRSLWYGLQDLAAETLARRRNDTLRLRRAEFMALQDVSFQLRRGQCLGLIGANGAGKSTILKLLGGLVRPDRGRVEVRGRVGALIELGAGFNPVLTGRENVYVNGAVLGLTRREVRDKFDEIVDFADLAEFIDAPVQSYSSGMRVRLGFAVAAHLDPDVLLVDEVLAVGDAGFRTKCYNRIAELAERSAIVFVSHNMTHVARLADRTLVLEHGRPVFLGRTPEAINAYYAQFRGGSSVARHGSGEVAIESLEFLDARDTPTCSLTYGEPFTIKLHAAARESVEELVVNVVFQTVGQLVAAQCNNYVRPHPIRIRCGERICVSMSVPELLLNPGAYRISGLLMSADMTRHYDWIENICALEVRGGRPAGGALQFLPSWRVDVGGGSAGNVSDE